MRTLIIGGTVFLGRHLVDVALARGDEVTIFHRGRHPAHAEVEEVLGDRAADLDRLAGRHFDAVIDTCGYLPREVRRSAETLAADHYTLISSGSVYAPTTDLPLTEDSALLEAPTAAVTDVHGELYGPQKVGCEQALLAARPGSALVARVGLLVGPYDPTDRLTYWATRMRRSGPVLAPAVPAQSVQFIDIRDLAEWLLTAAAGQVTGTMNVTGPLGMLTFGGLLELAAASHTDQATQGAPDAGFGPEIRWVGEDALIDAGVQPWSELPIWLPDRYGVSGLMNMDTSRAIAAGLRVRPPAETLADLAAWAAADPVRAQADYGTRARSLVMSAEREAELLAQLTS